MIKLKTSYFIAGAVIATAVALPLATFAHANGGTLVRGIKAGIHRVLPGKNRLSGTVTSINGTTLTVTDAKGTVYTIDASTAKIGNAIDSLSIANILVGDKVVVTGVITGTNETAKMISDASFFGRNIFGGTVTAVSGTSVTIDSMVKKVKTTYTVDVSSATLKSVARGTAATIAVADIKIGDRVTVDGTLSGVQVTATALNDMGQKAGAADKRGKPGFDKLTNMFSGAVTAVNGSIITIAGMNKTVYTIDASGAAITKGMGSTSTTLAITDVKVGDKVFAIGAITGTNIVATSVRDLGVFSGTKRLHKPL